MPKIKSETTKNLVRIYHATTEHVAKQACVKGLFPYEVPVYENGAPHTYRVSSSESICLTSVYPGLLAFDAVNLKEKWGVVEIDPYYLEQNMLAPHERFLLEKAKVKQGSEEDYFADLVKLRTEATKKRKQWRNSIENLGLCLYTKQIPLQAITKVTVYDPASNWFMTKAMINCNLSDHKFNFKRHQMLTRWLIGEHITGSQWMGPAFDKMPFSEQSKITSILQNKNGLDIYYFGNGNNKNKASWW
jgi:hypothetical protein